MKTNQIVSIAIAFIIGGMGGYFMGGNGMTDDMHTQKEQESITMMKDQEVTIAKMAEVMKKGGMMMQTMGTQYKNEDAMNTGKDLEMMGTKYMTDTTNKAGNTGNMDSMMK